MKKSFAGTLFTMFLLLGGEAGAQTFSAEMPAANNNGQAAPSWQQLQGTPAAKAPAPTPAPTPTKAVAEEDSLVKATQKNLISEQPEEEEYDNSFGKVTHFRIVDGKVVFDNDRKILVYYENYKVERGMDGIVRCSMRINVLNDLEERISNIAFKLKWPEISTNVQMNKLKPGVSTYMDVMLLGNGCLNMDKAPTIEVNRCRVKGLSESKCADAIFWFKKNQ